MANSNLVDYVNLTKNCTKPRNHAIDKITIHHMAGTMSAKQCADYFANTDREVSANYCIGSDGQVAMSVEEKNRAWTSSNRDNDHRAITIEVANDKIGGNWHVSDKALAKLIDLCTDICKRNGIKKLNFTGNANGNLTMHKYFTSTACPGAYLESKFPYIEQEVNKRLNPVTVTYRVRKTWKDSASQKGAFSTLDNAKKCADKNPGYSVFDGSGKSIYTSEHAKKTNEQIAKEVIAGKWGNGATRKSKLEKAGYDYNTIQKLVNKML